MEDTSASLCIEVAPLPGCTRLPYPQETLLVGKMHIWFCTPGCREHLPLSLDTSAHPRGSPGLGQVSSGVVCPAGEVTMMSSTPESDNLQESCADTEGRKMTRGNH